MPKLLDQFHKVRWIDGCGLWKKTLDFWITLGLELVGAEWYLTTRGTFCLSFV